MQETYTPPNDYGASEGPKSVFGDPKDLYRRWRATIQFTDKLKGGVPNQPDTMTGWLSSRMGLDETEELRRMVIQSLQERGVAPANADWDSLKEAVQAAAGMLNTNGFKEDEHGLYIEDRHIMAMLRESVGVLYTGKKWGNRPAGTLDNGSKGKAATSYFRERVHVVTKRVYLGRDEADGVMLDIVKPDPYTPSSLNLVEYVERAKLTFEVEEMRDTVPPEDGWKKIFQHAERNGLGAGRSQQHGKFVVLEWSEVGA